MSGYIKLHRAVRGTAIAQHPEYFAAWVHLLCMATHKGHNQVVGKTVVRLEPGQLVFGRKKFSATTGISENKIRASLDVMKQLGMITTKTHAKCSIISIVNWSRYQEQSPADNQQRTSNAPATHHKQEGSKKGEKGIKKTTGAIALDYSLWPELPDEQVLKDWVSARTKAKAKHSQTAINTIGKELHKAKTMGYSVNECLSEAATRGWRGFKAEWMSGSQGASHAQQPSRTRKDFPFGS